MFWSDLYLEWPIGQKQNTYIGLPVVTFSEKFTIGRIANKFPQGN